MAKWTAVILGIVLSAVAASLVPASYAFSQGEEKEAASLCPEFKAVTLKGEPVSSATIRDTGQLLVIAFWGLRCGSCIEEIPYLNRVHKDYGKRIRLLGVNADGAPGEMVAEQIGKMGLAIDYDVVADPELAIADLFRLETAPLTIVARPDRRIVYRHNGFVPGDEKELIAAIEKNLK